MKAYCERMNRESKEKVTRERGVVDSFSFFAVPWATPLSRATLVEAEAFVSRRLYKEQRSERH